MFVRALLVWLVAGVRVWCKEVDERGHPGDWGHLRGRGFWMIAAHTGSLSLWWGNVQIRGYWYWDWICLLQNWRCASNQTRPAVGGKLGGNPIINKSFIATYSPTQWFSRLDASYFLSMDTFFCTLWIHILIATKVRRRKSQHRCNLEDYLSTESIIHGLFSAHQTIDDQHHVVNMTKSDAHTDQLWDSHYGSSYSYMMFWNPSFHLVSQFRPFLLESHIAISLTTLISEALVFVVETSQIGFSIHAQYRYVFHMRFRCKMLYTVWLMWIKEYFESSIQRRNPNSRNWRTNHDRYLVQPRPNQQRRRIVRMWR